MKCEKKNVVDFTMDKKNCDEMIRFEPSGTIKPIRNEKKAEKKSFVKIKSKKVKSTEHEYNCDRRKKKKDEERLRKRVRN